MNIPQECVHTRAIGLHCLNQNTVLSARLNSLEPLTSTVTCGLVSSSITLDQIPKLICAQTQTNDSIAATYVIPSTMCQPLLTIAFRHVFPSSPAVTSLQGTREVAVICESPSALESLSELISSPVLIRTSRVASRVKPAPSRK